MIRQLQTLYGLKWNPFLPDTALEGLVVGQAIEHFAWRIEQMGAEGGFALITGDPGIGKSVPLRGSSERHAWGDSNLYLRRRDQGLRLSVEHRAARAPDDLTRELATDPLALRIADAPPLAEPPSQTSPAQRIEQALVATPAPLTVRELRAVCCIRSETLCATLDLLVAQGRVIKSIEGYSLVAA